MPKLAVLNMSGSQVGDMDLSESVFGIKPNKAVLHDAVVMQQASRRRGTHAVKGRSQVRGGGAKPWRQKGTGRARHGSIRSPLWVGGGTVFGPTPRQYGYKLPKKVRRLALKSALSSRVLENDLIVVDKLQLEQPKTKLMVETLNSLAPNKTVLVVMREHDEDVLRAARNLPHVKVISAEGLNVLDVLQVDSVVCTRDAIDKIEGVFGA